MPNKEHLSILSERLMFLRDSHQLSIAEMARRTGIPKRSMENYFKGQKPGYDALIAIADAFNVPVDFLCGRRSAEASIQREIIERAATFQISSFLRFLVYLTEQNRRPIRNGTILSDTPEEKALEIAREIADRAASVLVEYGDSGADSSGEE